MALARLSFQHPHHGWLPIRLELGGRVLEFEASDVPRDPVQELVDALHLAARHLPAEVWWHLEPAAWRFELSPLGTLVQLRVSFSEDGSCAARTEQFTAQGSKAQLLLPMWRALRQFQTFLAREPHWPEVRFESLQPLGDLLRAG